MVKANGKAAYVVMSLVDALKATFTTDAHLVGYVEEGADRQVRYLKRDLEDSHCQTHVLFADVDLPGHEEWTHAHRETFDALWRRPTPTVATCGVYFTKHGYRLVQPLLFPIASSDVEPYLYAWLRALESEGVSVDYACRDATRHFRLPNVRRKDKATGIAKPYISPFVDIKRMKAVAVTPLDVEDAKPARIPRVRIDRKPIVAFHTAVPASWEARIPTIAKAMLSWNDGRHMLYLGLAGALLTRGVDPAAVPAICTAVAVATWPDQAVFDRRRGAETTVERFQAGEPITSFVPAEVELAIEEALAMNVAPDAPEVDLRTVFRQADERVTILAAECGSGKTHAAIGVAVERAALKKRFGTKTAIACDKTSLAEQIVADLRAAGANDVGGVKRLFGPLSVKNPDGSHACIYHKRALHIVGGGLSMQKEFCQGRGVDPCPKFESCTARLAYEGEPDASIIVGPHAMLDLLAGEVGVTGLLIVDEPPQGVETIAVDPMELEMMERFGPWLSKPWRAFGDVMRSLLMPVLRDGIEWEASLRGLSIPVLRGALNHASLDIDETDGTPRGILRALAAKLGALVEIRGDITAYARTDEPTAVNIGRLAGTLRKLSRAARGGNVVRVGMLQDQLLFTVPNDTLERALKREGATILADAGGQVHIPVVRALVGYDPHFIAAPRRDGAPIERTLFRMRGATRTNWVKGDAPDRSRLYAAADKIVAWAGGRKLGVITFKALLSDAQFLSRFPDGTVFAYYGATRGINSMRELDALATIGDPRPNISTIEMEADAIGVSPEDRTRELARAELEQAHGRLRVVHRKRPAIACHVGTLFPGGWGWTPDRVTSKVL